jgi:lysophospholipase L1-like esterase
VVTLSQFAGIVLSLQSAALHTQSDAGARWTGSWATASQPALPSSVLTLRNQTLRLIVHTTVGGRKVRIRLSNVYGDRPLRIGGAHIARRVSGADVDSSTDGMLTFGGVPSVTIPAGAVAVSDAATLDIAPLSDVAVSLFLPDTTFATTSHILAQQISYVSDTGDFSAHASMPVVRKIRSWPFLTELDVVGSAGGATIVAFGASTTDGDGSTPDSNRRYPDVLAERLQRAGGGLAALGVLNEGIIGNRLLSDSPHELRPLFGSVLGPAAVSRFERDVLSHAGVRYVILALGVNDILFPGSFTPVTEALAAEDIIAGYRLLIARAHQRGIRIIGTTIPPFENATFTNPPMRFYTPQKEVVRTKVNAWMRGATREFDGVVDFDAVLRDPRHPSQLSAAYDSGDHLHMNDAGYAATANAIPLTLFRQR